MTNDLIYVGHPWGPATGDTGERIYIDLEEIPHMTMLGPPGTGKGVSSEIPNLLGDELRNANILNFDPTGQNRAVAGRFRSSFSDVEDLDPFGMRKGKGIGCNPMLSVNTDDGAMRLAEAVEEVKPGAHEPFWSESSQGLIGGVILAVAKD